MKNSEWRVISPDVSAFGTTPIQWTETGVGVLTIAGAGINRRGHVFDVDLTPNGGLAFAGSGDDRTLGIDPNRTIPATQVRPGIFGGSDRYRFPAQIRIAPRNSQAKAVGDIYLDSNSHPTFQTSSTAEHALGRKFVSTFALTANQKSSHDVTHNLGTEDVIVSVYYGAGSEQARSLIVGVGVSIKNTNEVTIAVDTDIKLPAGNYRVVVLG